MSYHTEKNATTLYCFMIIIRRVLLHKSISSGILRARWRGPPKQWLAKWGIRASVYTLYMDGTGELSRDPRTKRHKTRREWLAMPSKHTNKTGLCLAMHVPQDFISTFSSPPKPETAVQSAFFSVGITWSNTFMLLLLSMRHCSSSNPQTIKDGGWVEAPRRKKQGVQS